MTIDIILTAYKESKSVGKAIKCLIDKSYSGFDGKITLIQISPDKETLEAGKKAFGQIKNKNAKLIQIKDPAKGKPTALNLGITKCSSDIVVFTDGDVYFGKKALKSLVQKFIDNPKLDAVSGRPVSSDPKDYMMGYFGHLFADANHYRRLIDLAKQHQEKSKIFVRQRPFFPLSGYIMAVKRDFLNFDLPSDVLVDDGYISYMIFNSKGKLGYAPNACCFIKYPKTLSDYFKQKKRSTGGFIQLYKYNLIKKETKARNFWQEIEMFWFPFKYAKNFREFIWSSLLIPIRLWLWAQIIFEQRILKKDFHKIWVRIESTK